MTAPMLMTAWLVIQHVAATASRPPKRSGARSAARSPYQAKAPKSPSTISVPDQPALLADDREDEVGVGVGQQPPLLPPPAQAESEEMARAQSDERLHHLVPRALGVGEGVEERQQPGPAVGLGQADDQPERRRCRPGP